MTTTSRPLTYLFPERAEVPATLAEPMPRSLGLFDQLGLWANMGVTLLGFTGAIYVLQPIGAQLSLLAALVAVVVGTAIGTTALALAGAAGAMTGTPAMVLLRGLLGARLSYLPTALNILQCLGWGTFELVTIATAGHTVASGVPHWAWVLIAGTLTTAMTVRPLGAIRILRRYVLLIVVAVLAYLAVQLLRHPLPPLTHGSWSGFWISVDFTVAVAISFVPLAADYTRHARSTRIAVTGTLVGFGLAQIACYTVGLLALVTVAKGPADVYGAFIAVPLGTVCFAVLATRELDLSFADVYSTAISVQNARPRWDRRILGVLIGAAATVFALWLNIGNYYNFLLLLGSVFVPLAGVLIIDFFLLARGHWNLSEQSPARWRNLVPWAVGFVVYQLINPGTLQGWSPMWHSVANGINFTPNSWMSASLLSLAASIVVTVLLAAIPTGAKPQR